MKKILLIISMLSLSLAVNSQNSVRYYSELVGTYDDESGYLRCTIVICIDNLPYKDSWGKVKTNTDFTLVRKNGSPMESITEAANYMSQQGWHLLQVYCNSWLGTTHYVMYKDAPDSKKAVENLWVGRFDGYGHYAKPIPLVEKLRLNEDEEPNELENDESNELEEY